jgi:hypothetical protein
MSKNGYEKAPPREVNFFTYAQDFHCVVLANIGLRMMLSLKLRV